MMGLSLPWLIFVGAFALYAVVYIIAGLIQVVRDGDLKTLFGVIGLYGLYFLVALFLWAGFATLLPDWGWMHWTDENGDSRELKSEVAFVAALPVTYLLIKGFHAWRKGHGN